MMEASASRYEWGQRVRAAANLFNDGSYPEKPSEALLGHTGSGSVVYMVEFALNRVVGCFEHELAPAQSNGGAQ
jgi:nitrogen fixation protein NifZ